jgi:hypothetical protein
MRMRITHLYYMYIVNLTFKNFEVCSLAQHALSLKKQNDDYLVTIFSSQFLSWSPR